MKIAIAQLNPIVGDVDGNFLKLEETVSAFAGVSDIVVFPELFLTGYPPRDLLERPEFLDRVGDALNRAQVLSRKYPETGILFGAPGEVQARGRRFLRNSAFFLEKGKTLHRHDKVLLPAYDVFDETRYFEPADNIATFEFRGEKIGVTICEDMWNDPGLITERNYDIDPMEELEKSGATLLVNISASPFYSGKEDLRYNLVRNHARKYGVPFVFVNQVGGNDELVFDGRSICVGASGEVVHLSPMFRESVDIVDLEEAIAPIEYSASDRIGALHDALQLGISDYVRKCGFKKAVVGLSGGIDSSVVCVLAVKALGSDNVLGVAMPSGYSSPESLSLARDLAGRLGIGLTSVPISEIYSSYRKLLDNEFGVPDAERVEVYLQNIQARIRGALLMAFSNKLGYILLSTGNKSETAVGYCTLYGDMAGGLAAISDVPKTMVYKLAEYMNREKEIIPREIFDRPPSAELSPGQLDRDALPPYEILDGILQLYVEEAISPGEIVKKGYEPDTVKWVVNAVCSNEYKRRQAPPGLKVTTKAFGMGRRMPIASKYGL
ncbi:MAG: NAD+ synthase [Candidatus Omnitrophica bacterium]|nr:NAD+ synthase [Candidatus Omnitrophota bacterium]